MFPGIVRRTLGWGDRMLIAEVTLAAGGQLASHSHPHEQVGYVAQGRIELTLAAGSTADASAGSTADASASQTAVLVAGDSYTIPGGVTHSATALEDSVVVDVFSPVRDEYK